MKRLAGPLIVVALLLAAALALRGPRVRALLGGGHGGGSAPAVVVDGARWRPLLAWSFADGPGPRAWSWGDWRLAGGALEGRAPGDTAAVWFLPCAHGRDFLLETEVLVRPGADPARPAEAHLITRDSSRLHDETGVVIFADRARLYVRHRAGGRERLAQFADLPDTVAADAWHRLQLEVRGGRLAVRIDGRQVYATDRLQTVNRFREPHLAVKRGEAHFRNLMIYAPE